MTQRDTSNTKIQMKAFDQALRGLSKVGVPFQSDEPISSERLEGLGRTFRDDLMDEILEDHPLLTREELDRMMAAQGF